MKEITIRDKMEAKFIVWNHENHDGNKNFTDYLLWRIEKLEAWKDRAENFHSALPWSPEDLYKLDPDYIPEDDEDESDES